MATEEKLLSQLSQAVSTEDNARVLALLASHPNLLNVGWDDPLHREWNGVPWKDVLSQWYEALSREDSLQVMRLLANQPSLLNVGWGDLASGFEWKNKPWTPRTALHVGVRRGNEKLVEQVLILCEVDIRRHSTTDKQNGGNLPSTTNRGEPDEAEIAETQKNDIEMASSSQDGTWWEPYGQQAEWIRSAFKFVQEHPKDRKDTFVGRFLMARDGEYRLDAIAMGAIQGNHKNFRMLLYAAEKYKLYDIGLREGVLREGVLRDLHVANESKEDRDHKAELRKATEKVVQSLSLQPTSSDSPSMEEYKWAYNEHPDFNFLPWQEYFFHFLMAGDLSDNESAATELWIAVKLISGSTWRFLSDLHDGQGRTPWHAIYNVSSFKKIFGKDKEVVECLFSARDGTGRTAFQRTLASGNSENISRCEKILSCSDFPVVQDDMKLSPLLHERWHHSIYELNSRTQTLRSLVENVSASKGFARHATTVHPVFPHPMRRRESSHLHTAIIHGAHCLKFVTVMFANQRGDASTAGSPPKQAGELWQALKSCLRLGLESKTELALQQELRPWESWRLDHAFPYHWKQGQWWESREGITSGVPTGWPKVEAEWRAWNSKVRDRRYAPMSSWMWEEKGVYVVLDAVELATLVGHPRDVESLPLGNYFSNSVERNLKKQPWPALHIAANTANYETLKMLLDHPSCDPYVKDWNGNTALHHALNVVTIGKFQLHLLDHVDCQHVKTNYQEKADQEISDDNDLAGRKGCINLLLQAGCDIFKTNNAGQPPFPQGKLFKNSEFLSWWYDRQAKEFETTQRTLSSAANAISVTATLVATASYVGPLQPPMGYAGDPNQIQDANLWVRIFIFCDTMSFYLAIVSITLSLIPNLPMPEQKMAEEVGRTRWMVAISVIVLFPSIIFVLLAFVSSSIAVVSANAASTGGSLAITTASVGGLLCFITFTIFSARLLAFVFPRNQLIRNIYKATNLSSN